ncbi:hypothetical protein K440DRAFT_415191 [Wilcoxina mikolae CBS 423.85]|nr:hypothetical protein K440DRAFT_415191 [Wilcoxina mikolae CBS 423.85]
MNGSCERETARIDGQSMDRQSEKKAARQEEEEEEEEKEEGSPQEHELQEWNLPEQKLHTCARPHNHGVELMCPKAKQVTSSSGIFVLPGRSTIR